MQVGESTGWHQDAEIAHFPGINGDPIKGTEGTDMKTTQLLRRSRCSQLGLGDNNPAYVTLGDGGDGDWNLEYRESQGIQSGTTGSSDSHECVCSIVQYSWRMRLVVENEIEE